MKNVMVGLPTAPDTSINMSRMVADALRKAFAKQLQPAPVPDALLIRRTVSLPDDIAAMLITAASDANQSPAVYTAGLLRALELVANAEPVHEIALVGEELVRPILHPLLRETWQGLEGGKIVFAEAATGSGKGRFIASIALSAIARNQTVVIAAPLNVSYQLGHEIERLQPGARPILMLGRANFVDPYKVEAWLVAEANDNPQLQQWLNDGGPPNSTSTQALSDLVGSPLAWLLEDIVELVPDDAPTESWRLDDEVDPQNPAEMVYQRIKTAMRTLQAGQIAICSHIFLAADTRLHNINPEASTLPTEIDLLLVDEAHQLESAFATVYSSTLHLRSLERDIQHAGLPGRTSKSLLSACQQLQRSIQAYGSALPVTGRLEELERIQEPATSLRDLLKAVPAVKKNEPRSSRRALRIALHALEDLLSGRSTIQVDVSPIRHYPQFTVGRSNLEFAFHGLWSRVKAAALVSATLYVPDGADQFSATHMRWMLSVDKSRVLYTRPVAPKWVTSTPLLHTLPSPVLPPGPQDDPSPWIHQVSEQTAQIYQRGRGGMLMLCTSYHSVAMVAEELRGVLPEEVLIVQSPRCGASSCAKQFMQLVHQGLRPLWIGVGAAWTGVDLRDLKAHDAADDFALTDLWIPRLPFGTNRTLTHHRRKLAMGKGAGMMVEKQEALRIFKQGIGRLVRREGCSHRQLWIGDGRLQQRPVKPLFREFIKLLAQYRTTDEGDANNK